MKTLTPFDNLIAVEVPIEMNMSGLFSINKQKFPEYYARFMDYGVRLELDLNYTYKILGCVTPTEIDFDCETIVECIEVGEYKYGGELHPKDLFLDYETNTYWLESYDDSFRSLLSYNGIEIKEGYKLVILEKQ